MYLFIDFIYKNPPLFIEVPVPSHESERLCICVRCIYFVSLSMILILDFGAVPIVWCFSIVHYLVILQHQKLAYDINIAN